MPFEFGGGGSPAPTATKPSGGTGPFGEGSGGAGTTTNITSREGFKDVPTLSDTTGAAPNPFGGSGTTHAFEQSRTDSHAPSWQRPHVPRAASSGGFSMPDLPWGAIASVLGVLAVIAFVYVNRDAITSFVAQILSWAFGLFVVYVIFKIIFGRR